MWMEKLIIVFIIIANMENLSDHLSFFCQAYQVLKATLRIIGIKLPFALIGMTGIKSAK